jgi:hypothetical protein
MINTARFYLILAGVGTVSLFAASASANTATVRCVSRQDQISVYDSLSTRSVEAKLKCGEEVEIIGRMQDYVKIRAQNGVEGYVPAASFAGPATSEIHSNSTASVASANAASDNADSAMAVPEQSATAKKQTSGAPAAPSDTFAEMTPAAGPAPPADTPAKPTSDVSANHPPAANAASSSSPAKPAAEGDDMPPAKPENASADPACQNYFSAYGLAPSQMKWIAQNRKKLFGSVCPAPNVAKVDFVIIFTHDVDFFSATMPTPVHQVEGFSDFKAMTPMDPELMSATDADKARRQYVWIFRFVPGTFDPANFSPRRRYQFSTVESSALGLGSKAGQKTVEDAFRFVSTSSR